MISVQSWLRGLLRAGVIATVCMLTRAANAEALSIPGSGNPEHAVSVLAEAFNGEQRLHQVSVPPSTGTAGAIRDVESGTAILGRVGRPLKREEVANGLTFVSLGRDPVAFVGGATVTVQGLTSEQLIDVFSGKLSNWRDVGGNPSPIRAIGRESTDASRQAINKSVKPFNDIVFGDGVKLVHLDPQMIELLDRFPGSLGFLNRSALAVAKTKIAYLSLDGVAPSPENVEAGRYPIWLEFGLIHKTGSLNPAAKSFIEFIRSPSGRRLLGDLGVVGFRESPEPHG